MSSMREKDDVQIKKEKKKRRQSNL